MARRAFSARAGPLERAEPRVEAALAIAIAVIEPIAGALVPAGADQILDIGFHEDLQYRLRHGSQEITVTALLCNVNIWCRPRFVVA